MPALRLPEGGVATARLLIRFAEPADADAIATGIGDWEVASRLAAVPYPYSAADALRWIAGSAAGIAEGRSLPLIIVLGAAVIGGMGLDGLPEPRFGYGLARPHWGRGYATEAGAALLDHAFTVLAVPRVISGVFADNPSSLRVQRKLGFTRTGTGLVNCLARGTAVAHIDTALTADGWRMRERA